MAGHLICIIKWALFRNFFQGVLFAVIWRSPSNRGISRLVAALVSAGNRGQGLAAVQNLIFNRVRTSIQEPASLPSQTLYAPKELGLGSQD